MLFFDGDDPEQVKWAQKMDKQYKNNTKLVLVMESVDQQIKQWRRAIYFDQQGLLVKN